MAWIDNTGFLTEVFRAGVAAADPERATRQAVSEIIDLAPAAWVLAIGKGATGMARGALDALRARGVATAGGLVIAPAGDGAARLGIRTAIGDHPVPGERSFAAAERLGDALARVEPSQDAVVLISGGATSLMAAPVDGVSTDDLRALFTALLSSGADITAMNAIRKLVLRFGAGRLATALRSRRVHCLIASDVIGDDPAIIASGPCVPDPSGARHRALDTSIRHAIPEAVRRYIGDVVAGRRPDSPRANHERFASTSTRVILSRADAERGAAEAAHARGVNVDVIPEPMRGEAAAIGARFARQLVEQTPPQSPTCVIWSGESTVTLGAEHGEGGRCQEFALTAALELESAGARARGISVLAAGTDGRDGPTDAAGAIVDGTTCATIRASGADPNDALARHASYRALERAGALLKTGLTGTNVNDLVIALIAPAP